MFQIIIYGEDMDYSKECGDILFNIVDVLSENLGIHIVKSEEELFEKIIKLDVASLVFLHARDRLERKITLAEKMRQVEDKLEIVFIGGEKYFDFNVFKVQPFYFVRNEYLYDGLKWSIENFYNKYLGKKEIFQYTYNKKTYRLDVNSILYLESKGHVVHIVTEKENYRCYKKLDDMEAELQTLHHKFIRVHKSYCVNTDAIQIYSNEKVTLKNGKEITISKSRRNIMKNSK